MFHSAGAFIQRFLQQVDSTKRVPSQNNKNQVSTTPKERQTAKCFKWDHREIKAIVFEEKMK